MIHSHLVLSLIPAVAAAGPNYVRVESGGQSYVVDTDSYAVQKNLKAANR